MKKITDVLSEKSPENKDFFLENKKINTEKLESLKERYEKDLSALKGRNIIVSHSAFAYLFKPLGINEIGIKGIVPEAEVSATRMKEVIEYIKKNDIKVIYSEGGSSSKISETIAKEASIEILPLYTLEFRSVDQVKANKEYFSIMEENLENLKKSI